MKGDIKAVLFDLDNTLFDRASAQSRILQMIIDQFPNLFGRFDVERVVAAFVDADRRGMAAFEAGAPAEAQFAIRSELLLLSLGVEKRHVSDVAAFYAREYPLVNAPMPGAVATVIELSQRFIVGVVSNGLSDVQYGKLDTIGLRDYFSCVVVSGAFGVKKPDPRIFRHAASLLQVQPNQCLYVGDSYSDDIVGAKNSDMLACWLQYGRLPTSGQAVEADFVITDVSQFSRILASA